METNNDKYEAVIGLEVHIQLLTQSKIFSKDKNEFGAAPNTNVSTISLGHPGTLPKLNRIITDHAVKLGLACQCNITTKNEFSRKNYFYADLPKGYQVTQFATPICTGGFMEIRGKETDLACPKRIHLTRIHIEEDAGKSIHDQDPFFTLIDLNRAGVPLLEMVTEPEIHSAEDAYRFLSEVRKLVRYLDICDGNMEEGSMRCDANISVRLKGEKKLGQKVEVKNMNSIRNVQRAIQFEIGRQTGLIVNGNKIVQETRSFDAEKGNTFGLRSKEQAHDYRYFPEPDLLPFIITESYIDHIKKLMPPLPHELFNKYVSAYGLPAYDAALITDDRDMALYFEKIIENINFDRKGERSEFKSAANWLMVNVKSYLNEKSITISDFPLGPGRIAELVLLVGDGKISHSTAAQQLFPLMIKFPEKKPSELAAAYDLLIQKDAGSLEGFINMVMENYLGKIKEYKAGKKGLIGLFVGEVMKMSRGKADPKLVNQLIKQKLDETKE